MKIPFNPSVYEHAARFTGRTVWEVSRDPELMYEGHKAAWLEYRHTPIVVGIDIYNLEAEAYGGEVERPGGDGIPAIQRPILRALEDGFEIAPFDVARDGRLAMVIDVARRLKAALPEADVRIPVWGRFRLPSICGASMTFAPMPANGLRTWRGC